MWHDGMYIEGMGTWVLTLYGVHTFLMGLLLGLLLWILIWVFE